MIEGGNVGVDYTGLDISDANIQRVSTLLYIIRTTII